MTDHCSSRWKSIFTRVKADFLPDFPRHPMLLSAYLKELIPQSWAGSKLRPQQQKSFREAPFHSRNTLPQPSFRNSLLNTVHYCKPQSAIYFILPSAFIWFQSPVAWFPVYVTYPLYIYIYIYIKVTVETPLANI